MEAKFSCAAEIRNRWMASCRTAAGLLSSSIARRREVIYYSDAYQAVQRSG